MIRYAAYTLLVMGLASQALADPVNEPYQPELARMSTRNILGLHRRAMEGYAPVEQLCGDGDTCAEACGKGFSQCASKDNLTHCYNRSKKQECCPGGTGDACDNGYFCSADDAGKTWCCPDGLSLKECAQKYNIPGPLTSQAPQVSSTSTTITTTTTKPTKTKSADSSDAPKTSSASSTTTTSTKKPVITSTTSSKILHHESTSKSEPKETSSTTPTTLSSSATTLLIDVSSALVATAGVTAQTTALDLAPSSTPSTPPASSSTVSIGTNGSGSYGPVNALVLLIAGALAALV
ncbi:hypothetical protein EV127DRAFT_237958 [Xylaria flabelliformis]|nr:hypothetical protein EV127DRAFT_237958 [Xylaria flabelliformis]